MDVKTGGYLSGREYACPRRGSGEQAVRADAGISVSCTAVSGESAVSGAADDTQLGDLVDRVGIGDGSLVGEGDAGADGEQGCRHQQRKEQRHQFLRL